MVLNKFIQLVQTIIQKKTYYSTELQELLPNDIVSMSVGHLDHVLTVYSSMDWIV